MRCKQGDLAFVVRSRSGNSEGKIVSVDQYIGHFKQNDSFEYNGILCQVPITDHYWWISTSGHFVTATLETSKAYSPDLWLCPINPDGLDESEQKSIETPIVAQV